MIEINPDTGLAHAVEENLFALFRAMATLPGSELFESQALSYHATYPPLRLFNGVWQTRLAANRADEAIERTLDRFKVRGTEEVTWWFNQHTSAALLERLPAHGFEMDYVSPGMAIDLDALDDLHLPEALTIVEANDAATLADWATAFYGSYAEYEMPFSAAQAFADATLAFGAGGNASRAPWRMYVAYWDAQPAGTNILFNGAGAAGLYCVGTIPEVRGKGVGTGIILKPLIDARADGYHVGVLFSSEMALPIYEHLGFRQVGIQIGRYVWRRE